MLMLNNLHTVKLESNGPRHVRTQADHPLCLREPFEAT